MQNLCFVIAYACTGTVGAAVAVAAVAPLVAGLHPGAAPLPQMTVGR